MATASILTHNPSPAQTRPTLLDLALTEVDTRTQWASGQSVTIWQQQPFEAWIKSEGGYLTLTLFRDGRKLTDRRYSKSLAVGYFDPQHQMWVQMSTARMDYEGWKIEAKRAVGLARRVS